MSQKPDRRGLSRREFNHLSASTLVAPLLASVAVGSEALRESESRRQKTGGARQRLNNPFIFSDHEGHTAKRAPGGSLPGHERLRHTGVTRAPPHTHAHQCPPSRARR